MLNQLNINKDATYTTLANIDSDITIIVEQDMTDEDSPRINYLDLGSDFLFLMFFSELQAPDRIGDLIDQRRAYFDQALDDIARVEVESPAGPGRAFVRGFGKAIYTAALRYLSDNQKPLLDELTTNHGSRPDAGGGNGPDAEHDNKTTQAAE
jgi:hypothetical protein